MNKFLASFVVLPALLLAGCSSTSQVTGPILNTAQPAQPVALPTTPTPAQTTQTALASTNAGNFVEPAALGLLSARERTEASSAAFYALQFGRPGAPRSWSGDAGASGSVTVGPYVRVNNLDCRDFTHKVTVGGKDYTRKGTACREQTGNWAVVEASSAA